MAGRGLISVHKYEKKEFKDIDSQSYPVKEQKAMERNRSQNKITEILLKHEKNSSPCQGGQTLEQVVQGCFRVSMLSNIQN